MKKTKDVFISYKRIDGKAYAHEFYEELSSLGYSVFLDTEILQNGKYESAIMQRIADSTDFLIIITPSLQQDGEVGWLKKEVDFAIEKGKNIIPIYYISPDTLCPSLQAINEYNGIKMSESSFTDAINALIGRLMLSTQDITYKSDPKKSDEETLDDLRAYMHRHTTRAFMELAIGAAQEGELHDENYSLALLAQESDYDVISFLWILAFKCKKYLSAIPPELDEIVPVFNLFIPLIEDTLAAYAILIDEGKLDTGSRYFPKLRKLMDSIIDFLLSDTI